MKQKFLSILATIGTSIATGGAKVALWAVEHPADVAKIETTIATAVQVAKAAKQG